MKTPTKPIRYEPVWARPKTKLVDITGLKPPGLYLTPTHYREFTIGEASGRVYFAGNKPSWVEAKHGTTKMVIDGAGGFSVTDEHDPNFEIRPEPKGVGPSNCLILGMNRRALSRSVHLFDTVGRHFLPQFDVRYIQGCTPNASIADMLKERYGAEVSDMAYRPYEMVEWYHKRADAKLVDPKFRDSVWKRITLDLQRE